MEESKNRAIQFEKELKGLLKKYNTEIEIEDTNVGYNISNTMKVYIPAIWDKDGDCIAESAEIVLGRYYDCD
jgi:uncharacterized FlaG/YvyC family protein